MGTRSRLGRGGESGGGENRSLRSLRPQSATRDVLEVSIADLENLDIDDLRLQWRNQLGGIAPAHLPKWLLLRMPAFRMQAAVHGDLDKATMKLLRPVDAEIAGSLVALPFETRAPSTRERIGLKAGALLVREWKGKLERVMVLDSGFAWNGQPYRSLSQIAKAMTGTNWNGHRFFGLRSTGNVGRRSKAVGSKLVGATDGTAVVASLSNQNKETHPSRSNSPDATVKTRALVRNNRGPGHSATAEAPR